MFKKIKVTHEQYHTLLQIEELITSEIYSTGADHVEESILKDLNELIEEYQKNNEHLNDKGA
tara:strand:- start:560 stop:745 length:186 start_codon:yes stop_codon:yes gene_type:complete